MAQINHSTGNNQFSQEYMPFIVRWGRITNLLGVVLCFLPPLVLTFGFGFNPGLTAIITGALAQVSGRNYIAWDNRLEKDVEYVEHLSFAMDVKVFFKTIQVLFAEDDVAVDTDVIEGNLAEIRAAARMEK